MTSMISLETEDLEDVMEDTTPDVVRLTQQGRTIDLTEEATETPTGDHPLQEHFAVAPGNTIYQRRGGGLRRRLEEEDLAHPNGSE